LAAALSSLRPFMFTPFRARINICSIEGSSSLAMAERLKVPVSIGTALSVMFSVIHACPASHAASLAAARTAQFTFF
jgi:hypothetical protein